MDLSRHTVRSCVHVTLNQMSNLIERGLYEAIFEPSADNEQKNIMVHLSYPQNYNITFLDCQ